MDLISQVWALNQEWCQTYEAWRRKPFLALNPSEMEEVVQKYWKKVTKLGKEVKNWDIFLVLDYLSLRI